MRTRLKNHILGKQPSFREQLNLFFSNSFLFTMLVISIFFFWSVAFANLTSHTEALIDSLLLDLDQNANGDLSDESPQVTAIELGHATDTTITRTGAGAIAVEGTAVLLSGGAAGQPSSIDLTNGTSLPLTGTTGTVANLMTALTDEGAFADDLLGYASAAAVLAGIGAEGDLANSTGLAAALSDETGTGYSVFSDSPALTTLVTLNNGSDFRIATTTTAHEWSIQIYDNDDTTWRDAFNFANGDSPTVTFGAGVVFDFTGAGSVNFGPLVLPTTTSGDQTLTNDGQIGYKDDEDLFVINGGSNGEVQDEAGISLINTMIVRLYATTEYDNNDEHVVDLLLMDDAFPHGITLTEWKIENINGDYATTQLDVDLICDSGGDWNDDAGTTVMDVLDTTSGSATADSGFDSSTCANGSSMYLRFGADPVDDDEPTRLKLQYYRNED